MSSHATISGIYSSKSLGRNIRPHHAPQVSTKRYKVHSIEGQLLRDTDLLSVALDIWKRNDGSTIAMRQPNGEYLRAR